MPFYDVMDSLNRFVRADTVRHIFSCQPAKATLMEEAIIQNTPAAAKKPQVWSVGDQKILKEQE